MALICFSEVEKNGFLTLFIFTQAAGVKNTRALLFMFAEY
jgi:hypothetical protein